MNVLTYIEGARRGRCHLYYLNCASAYGEIRDAGGRCRGSTASSQLAALAEVCPFDKESHVKKKLSLNRETLMALESPLSLRAAGAGFSGITTCVYCNVTKVQGTCGGTTTIQ